MNVQAEGAAQAMATNSSMVHNAAAWTASVDQVAEGFAVYAQQWTEEGLLSDDAVAGVALQAPLSSQAVPDGAVLATIGVPVAQPAGEWEGLSSMAATAVRMPQGMAVVAATSGTAVQPRSALQMDQADSTDWRAVRHVPAAVQPVSAPGDSEVPVPTVLEAVPSVLVRGLAAEPARTEAASRTVLEQLPVPVHKGAQPLVQALAQRIQVQQAHGADIATVRLDPPQMGSLEIRIRQDGAAVQVQLHASHSEVGRQLTTLVETLRQELQQRSSDVQVTVAQSRTASQQGGQGEGQRQQHPSSQEPVIGQALEAWNGQA